MGVWALMESIWGQNHNILQLVQQMFDELYYNEENSLDLLLKFSTESQGNEDLPEYSFEPMEKDLAPTNNNISSLIDLFTSPLESTDHSNEKEVGQMRKAVEDQENKLKNFLNNKNRERPKPHLSIKRKASECTEAPNSPLRKTKPLRKEKS